MEGNTVTHVNPLNDPCIALLSGFDLLQELQAQTGGGYSMSPCSDDSFLFQAGGVDRCLNQIYSIYLDSWWASQNQRTPISSRLVSMRAECVRQSNSILFIQLSGVLDIKYVGGSINGTKKSGNWLKAERKSGCIVNVKFSDVPLWSGWKQLWAFYVLVRSVEMYLAPRLKHWYLVRFILPPGNVNTMLFDRMGSYNALVKISVCLEWQLRRNQRRNKHSFKRKHLNY